MLTDDQLEAAARKLCQLRGVEYPDIGYPLTARESAKFEITAFAQVAEEIGSVMDQVSK